MSATYNDSCFHSRNKNIRRSFSKKILFQQFSHKVVKQFMGYTLRFVYRVLHLLNLII